MARSGKLLLGFIYEDQIAALLMFTASFTGFLACSIVVFSIRKVPVLFRSFFGKVSRIQSTAGFCHQFIFAFIVAPTLFFEISIFLPRRTSVWFAFVLEIAYEFVCYGHVLLAGNRGLAAFFPLSFSKRAGMSEKKQILIVLLLSVPLCCNICVLIYTYWIADCDYFLDKQSWAFVFSEEPECIELRLNSSFYRYLAMLCIVGSLDMASFVRFHQLQACAQASLFFCDIMSAFVLVPLLQPGQWLTFILATIVWVSAIGGDSSSPIPIASNCSLPFGTKAFLEDNNAAQGCFLILLTLATFEDYRSMKGDRRGEQFPGMMWVEMKQLWEEGLTKYHKQWWNWLDFAMICLYLYTIAIRTTPTLNGSFTEPNYGWLTLMKEAVSHHHST